MDLRKVKPGDEIRNDAAVHNAFIDAANWVRQNQSPKPGSSSAPEKHADWILVQNISGVLQERFAALAIGDPVITPAANVEEFKRRVVMKAKVPTADDVGRWCVLYDTLLPGGTGTETNGGIGVAIVAGVCVCKINLANVADTTVDVVAGSTIPSSSAGGSVQILWVAGGAGTATATGEQWAVIRLGSGSIGKGTLRFQVLQMVTDTKIGWDWVRFH
jgi:hypothetical protein